MLEKHLHWSGQQKPCVNYFQKLTSWTSAGKTEDNWLTQGHMENSHQNRGGSADGGDTPRILFWTLKPKAAFAEATRIDMPQTQVVG